MSTTPMTSDPTVACRWRFLDVGVELLRAEDPTVMKLALPLGAAPPEHVHAGYDDSFLVLEGQLTSSRRR